jgi:hypothetical protein
MARAASNPRRLHSNSTVQRIENAATIVMDRTSLTTVIAFTEIFQRFVNLILQDRFLQSPQPGLCVVKEQAQVLRSKFVGRTVKSTDLAPQSFSIVKRCLDKKAYFHGGSRLVLKPLP